MLDIKTKNFIKNSKNLYPGQFDYSEAEYKYAKEKIKLYCLKHDEPHPVLITPSHHLGRGHGCKKCKIGAQKLRDTLTQEEFVERAQSYYPKGFDFEPSIYVTAKTPINVKCITHNRIFSTTPDIIKSKRMAGCEHCIKEHRLRGTAQGNKKRMVSLEEIQERVQESHSDKFLVDYEKYKGSSLPINVTCTTCGYEATPRVERFINWKGCPNCNKGRSPANKLSDSALISRVVERQNNNFNVILVKREDKTSDSLIELACKKHKNFQKTIRYSNSKYKVKCSYCYPEKIRVRTEEEKTLGKLSKKFISKNYVYHGLDLIAETVIYDCNTHKTIVQSIDEYLKFGCVECKKVENKERFLSSLSAEQKERNDYSGAKFTELALSRQAVSYQCKLHLEPCTQNIATHLKNRTACQKCRNESRKRNLENRRMLEATTKRAGFLKEAVKMWGKKRYSYPYIGSELFLLTDDITIYCHIHEKEFTCPAGPHIQPRKDKGLSVGRGCPDCKKETLRRKFRAKYEKVKEGFIKRGLEILSDESKYKNGRSKLEVKCVNNHITLATVSKVTNTGQGCTECSGQIGEEITRRWFEEYFGCEFKKDRKTPSSNEHQWLELDGYNEDLKIAFEYQGIYHISPTVHKTKKRWHDQLKRDENTRKMCKERGIRLYEVILFKNGNFKDSHVIESIKKSFEEHKIVLGDESFSNINQIIDEVSKGSSQLFKIEEVCEKHNLTLVDQLRWLGSEHAYKFECNECSYIFSSSISRRSKAKHECCPRCARWKGAETAKVTNSRKDTSKYLRELSNKVQSLGVKLTTDKWLGSSYKKVYEGLCLNCDKPTPKFNYNQVLTKNKLCLCLSKKKAS